MARLDRTAAAGPEIDPAAPLQFVINAAAGRSDAQTERELIETALRLAGRRGELLFSRPAEVARVAQPAAAGSLFDATA